MVLGFIGLGNMAKALIGGILGNGLVAPEDIIGSAATQATRDAVAAKYGINTSESNAQVARDADIILLAVKPQYISVVLEDIREAVEAAPGKLLISIAAGKTTKWIASKFDQPVKIVRVIPNTPALVGSGCSALCRNENVTDEEFASAKKLMECCGMAEAVPETLMDAVCGVSGSAPAFVFVFIDALADAAVKGGMTRRQAYQFAAQTVYGSAKLMLDTGKIPAELKDMVTSPSGTTIAGVQVLEEGAFRGIVMDAVEAAIERSKEL